MDHEAYSGKKGHPVLGIVLGILGILISFLALFCGVISGAVAGVLGVAAVLLGLAARKGGRGIGAIIAGALAIVLAVSLTVSSVSLYAEIRKEAEASGNYPLVVRTLDKPYLGMVGMIINFSRISGNEATLQELTDQINDLSNAVNAAHTEAPAHTAEPAETEGTAEPAAEAPREGTGSGE